MFISVTDSINILQILFYFQTLISIKIVMIGTILNNRYRVKCELGQGSEGDVFCVEDIQENDDK